MGERRGSTGVRLRLGTRRSRLAVAQAERVASRLRSAWPGLAVEIVGVDTEGDRSIDRPLPEIGGKGLFTAELAAALARGRIDAAVHSMKDLPTAATPGIVLACVPERADPADVLICRTGKSGLDELPEGSVIGTSSLRRAAQLAARRPDLVSRPVRGNVETRIRKCREGGFDGILLAAAGLGRLGLETEAAARLDPADWLPAPGQGALAVQARADDEETRHLLGGIDDAEARAAVECERELLAALEGGCQVPIGAWARPERGRLRLDAAVFSDLGRSVRVRLPGGVAESPAALGRTAAARLLAAGAEELLAGARTEEG